ncbi:MAG: recombination regulator RecX [Lentisphaeria bacterium]|nr:recombination regulator RecX [Lentisphaeria bacterium]
MNESELFASLEFKRHLAVGMRGLSRRLMSEHELREYLIKRKVPEHYIAPVCRYCLNLGFVNDSLLAEDAAGVLSYRGCGSYRIKRTLARRGIDKGDIENALSAVADGEYESALRAAEYKMRSLSRESDMRRKRDKIYRFLIVRGYKYEIIRQVTAQIFQKSADVDNMEDEPDYFWDSSSSSECSWSDESTNNASDEINSITF